MMMMINTPNIMRNFVSGLEFVLAKASTIVNALFPKATSVAPATLGLSRNTVDKSFSAGRKLRRKYEIVNKSNQLFDCVSF